MYLKSRGLWVWRTHWNGLCILKPENFSPYCRDIIVLLLLEMIFLFSTFMRVCFDFLGQKTGLKPRGHRPPASPHATALCKTSRITSLRNSRSIISSYFFNSQGAKKVIFKASHSGKLKLAYTSPNIISTSLKNNFMSRIDFTVLL